jgi:para-nitrobenzyl esterase
MRRDVLSLLACLAVCGCGSSSASSTHHDAGTHDAAPNDAPNEAAPPPAATCGQTMTKDGPVLGTPSGATCAYEGIPFAAPPVGALRWKAPEPPAAWTTPRPSQFQSGCPQSASLFGVASTNEDCLYLNVWTPPPLKKKPLEWGAPRPVMVFVHGGGFLDGSGSFPLYDGTKLAAATGNIVVTINYRLGAFGFMSNAALRQEDPHGSAGDYGIEDQIAAFQWVKDNIAAFGGDAQNVTIFGESAGGSSMFVQLASPLAKGLFEHVMIESGWAPDGHAAFTEAQADAAGSKLASALGCTDASTLLTCLRGKSASQVLAADPAATGSGTYWFPDVDGYVLPQDPLAAFAAGHFNRVPTLLGNNQNEGTLFLFASPPTDPTSFLALEEASDPGHGSAIVAEYPIASYGNSYFQAAAAALTDGEFLCPTRKVARALATAGVATYRYDFAHSISFIVPNLGAFHGSELLFVFGNPIEGVGLQAAEQPLSDLMQRYWGSMAATGDPNGAARFTWPKYDVTNEPEVVLDLTPSTVNQYRKAQCDFWDGIDK